jgi:ABC-type sugar transport system ATPase subunit
MIQLKNVSVENGSFNISNVSLDIERGEYVVLEGATGSGKSTLLEAIVGLRPIAEGNIFVDGNLVSSLPPGQRNIGYVPQDVSLFPTMTVKDQLSFSLDVRRIDLEVRIRRVKTLIDVLELGDLRYRLPFQLSGGQRQRVAIGRALAFRPKLLCLDEPLSAIDVQQRHRLVALLKSVHELESTTILHVTHQINDLEAIDARQVELHSILGN